MEKLKEQSIVLENQNEILIDAIAELKNKYTGLRTQVLRFVDGKQADKFNRLNNYRQGLEKGKENQAFYNALKSKPDFLALRQNILDQQEYNRQLDAVQAEYIRVSNELDALERGELPIEPKVMIDDKGEPDIKADEADTILDNLAEMFEADADGKIDDTIKPVDFFEPMPIPNIKPKKDDTMTEKPLYKTTEYTSNANKIELTNGDIYYRNKEQFIDKQSKIALTKLLTKLDIDYTKWSSTTKGTNISNVKAFRTTAWDILKDNPRLTLLRGTHWFKK
jgi:hypothetical protein